MRLLPLALIASTTLLWAASANAQPEVEVNLDAAPLEARVGEMIRLEVRARASGARIEDLELRDLKSHPELEIVSHQISRPVQFSFGFGSGIQVESSLADVYILRATAPGTYEFAPAIAKVDGKLYRSQPLTLVVHPGGADASGTPSIIDVPEATGDSQLSGAYYDGQAFLRTIVEPDEVYLGQQVSVTVYLYTRLRLSPQSVIPSKPSMDGFWVHDEPITTLQPQSVAVRGERYQAYLLQRSAAFPQRSGELTVGPPKITFDVGGASLFDPPERIQREGVPVTVKVKPLPQPGPADAVVGRYEVRASLDRTTADTGDAVTLRVEASGIGNVQDLRVDLPPIAGVRALQPAVRDQQQLQNGKLLGTRSWEWILIAEAPGEHAIPPIELHYFDPDAGRYGSASTPILTFTSTGAAKASPPALEPANARPKPPVETFGPISMYSALSRGGVPIRERGWFAWLLALPPLVFILVVVGGSISRRREQQSTTSGAVQRKLVRSARSALESDDPREFYDRVVASINHALDSRLEEAVGGLPHAQLRARLIAEGLEEDLVQRVINELEGADFARFAASGVSKEEMERCLERSAAIIERIQRSRGRS